MELAIAVTQGTLMLSPNADYLEATLGNQGRGRPLADSPQYREIAVQFPARSAMITYQRQDGRLEGLYEQLRSGMLRTYPKRGLTLSGEATKPTKSTRLPKGQTPFRIGTSANGLPGLAGQLLSFDFTKLPPFPQMSRYLQSTGSFIVPEDDGFRVVSFATPPREP
jgi:hypothetical protein